MQKAISLSGPDGSGKTSIARLYYTYLGMRGCKATVHWFRGTHLFASVIARCLSKFDIFHGFYNPYYNISIPRRLRSLWILIEFLSIIPYVFTRRFLSMFMIVIGDRGILDFIVWLIATLDYPDFLETIIGEFLIRWVRKETIICITASPRVINIRARGLPKGFLSRELACYRVLSRYYAKCVVDTTNKTQIETLGDLIKCIHHP